MIESRWERCKTNSSIYQKPRRGILQHMHLLAMAEGVLLLVEQVVVLAVVLVVVLLVVLLVVLVVVLVVVSDLALL